MAHAREITWRLVQRDIKLRYRGTFLGLLWSLGTPILTVAAYYFVFAVVFRASPATDVARPDGHAVPLALYMFSGLSAWTLFSGALTAAAGSIVVSAPLLNRVWFPRAILPLSAVLSNLVFFTFELAILLLAGVIILGPLGFQLLWLPLVVLVILLLAYGIGLVLSAVSVYLRDIDHVMAVLMWFWMLATPVVYSLQLLAGRGRALRLMKFNPAVGPVVSFRNIVVLDRPPDFGLLGYSVLVGIAFLILGAAMFHRWQRSFAELL